MLAGRAHRQVIPQIHILANRTVNTADITDQLAIKEYPQIIVAEEVVFQRARIVRRKAKRDSKIHTEEPVMRLTIVADREIRCQVCPFVTIALHKSLESARIAVGTP